jgi:hypothetical protein
MRVSGRQARKGRARVYAISAQTRALRFSKSAPVVFSRNPLENRAAFPVDLPLSPTL